MPINIIIIAKSYEDAIKFYEQIYDVHCDAADDDHFVNRGILYCDYKHGIAIRYIKEYVEMHGIRANQIYATKEVMDSEWYKVVVKKFLVSSEIPIDIFIK